MAERMNAKFQNCLPTYFTVIRGVKFFMVSQLIFFVLRNYLGKSFLDHSSRIEIRILHYLLLCRLLGFKFWRCHFRLSLVKPTLLFCESRYTLIQMCTYNLWNNIEESADKTVRNFQGCTLLFTYVLFSVTMDIFILDS